MISSATATSIGDLFGAREQTLLAWLDQGPVLAHARYLRAGGARDWVALYSADELRTFVLRAPVGTDVLVFHPQVLAQFVPFGDYPAQRAAIVQAAREGEVLVVAIGHQPDSNREASWMSFTADDQPSIDGAIATLASQSRGALIGVAPDYSRADDDTLMSAVVGNIKGPR